MLRIEVFFMSTISVTKSENGFFQKIKEFFKNSEEEKQEIRNKENKINHIISAVENDKIEWLSAISNYEQAENEDVIDYYAYKIKACQIQYNYLLKEAKKLEMRLNSNNGGARLN